MKKQTAGEWLENQIKTSKYSYKLMEDINSKSTVAQSDIFEQAKAMEKEQHKSTYNQGLQSNFQDFEQYYTETYGK